MIFKPYLFPRLLNLHKQSYNRRVKFDYYHKMETPKIRLRERLSSAIRPTHYSLTLNPNLKTGLFEGHVCIDIRVTQDQNSIVLNTKFLDISDVKLFKNDDELPIAKFLEVLSLEQLLIHLNSSLPSGLYQLKIKFNGNLTRNIVGLYLSHQKNSG